ncbi:MAG: type II secretion system GspH family protein [Patescibacteria group bacterium]|nr:type II secretion system GspH family protein [Patescibacteria group bacterium]
MFRNSKKGFTLIELLVVIAIIGTLSGIVLVSLGGARSKARDAVRQSDLRQFVSAQELYYGDFDAYLQAVAQDGTPAVTPYLDGLNDPQSTNPDYKWQDNSATGCNDSQVFCVYATLENNGSCTTARYFASSEKGTKEVCDTAPVVGIGDCVCF